MNKTVIIWLNNISQEAIFMKKRIISLIILLSFSTAIFAQSYEMIDDVVLEPKDPIIATVAAIGPGLLAHGFGHFYAEDYKMGLMLFGLELLSLIPITVGWLEMSNPSGFDAIAGNEDEVRRAGAITMSVGVLLFAATWFVDIMKAGEAAEQYNKENNLEFRMQNEAGLVPVPSLMLTYKF